MSPSILTLLLILSPEPKSAQAIQTQLVELAKVQYITVRGQYQAGLVRLPELYHWSVRWMKAEPEPKVARRAHLKRMEALLKLVEPRVEKGMAAAADLQEARYYVLEARLWIVDPRAGP